MGNEDSASILESLYATSAEPRGFWGFAKESTNKSEKKKHKKHKSGHQSTDKNNSR